MACALALCLSMATLPACSNNGTGAAGGSAGVEKVAVTEKTFVGDWSAVKATTNGVSISGVLSTMGLNFVVNFAEDGTSTMTLGEASVAGTWQLSGEKATLKLNDSEELGLESVVFTVEDESTLIGVVSVEGNETTLTFAKGKDAGSQLEYDAEKAQSITDSSKLIGTWNIRAVSIFGMCVSGDFANLDPKQFSGVESFKGYGLSLKEDGTGTFTQDGTAADATWKTTSTGTTLTSGGMSFELKMVDDCLMIDVDAMLESLLGSESDMGVYIFLSKAE